MEKRLRLAIVDDDTALLGALGDALTGLGYSCETFSRAEPVLEKIATADFDALITDIVMPGMRGLDLTIQVKHRRPDLSVIVMTGFIGDFSYDQAIEAGASDFIKKPFTVEELIMRVKHVKLQERLQALSVTDELTGLPNRRGFFTIAQQQMKMALRTGKDVVLLFADLDHFKKINDTWGHRVGDEALMAAADIFRKTFRDSDIIARMSGDEFAILLIDTPERNYSVVSDRLQKNLDVFNADDHRPYTLSISIGMAVYNHERDASIDELLKEADARMYEQKQRKALLGDRR